MARSPLSWKSLACVAAITVATAGVMSAYRDARMDGLIMSRAEAALDLIFHDLKIRIDSIERMARRLEQSGGAPGTLFDGDAAQHLADMPGFFAISWLDEDGVVRFVQPPALQDAIGKNVAEFGDARRLLIEAAKKAGKTRISRPVDLQDGSGYGFLAATPVASNGRFSGMLWSVFNADIWIRNLYFGVGGEFREDLAIEILLDDRPLYADDHFDEIDAEIATTLARNVMSHSLRVLVKPRPAFESGAKGWLVEVVTIFSAILTSAIALTLAALDRSRRSERRAVALNRELQDANCALRSEIESRRTAELEAREASKAKSQFLNTISHKIRTPMNGVLGLTDLLLHTSLDDRQQLYVKTISNSGSSLVTLINDILDFSEVNAGKLRLVDASFNLKELIDDVIVLLSHEAARKNIEVRSDFDRKTSLIFTGDPDRTRQIVTNIVGNAIKFTAEGFVRVSVSASVDGDVTHVDITVEDSGIGIPKDRLASIFEAFRQVDGDANREFGGAGLGLTISRRLAEAMGGTISVESESGRGSTFIIRLPLRACGGAARPHPADDRLSA